MGQFLAPPLDVGHLSSYWYVIPDPELLLALSSRVDNVAFTFSFPLAAPVPQSLSKLKTCLLIGEKRSTRVLCLSYDSSRLCPGLHHQRRFSWSPALLPTTFS